MAIDPLFRVPSEIFRGCIVSNPRQTKDSSITRAELISQAAYAVRAAMYASYEAHAKEPAEFLPMDVQTKLLMAAFCGHTATLARYRTPELDRALEEFRALVPLVPLNAIERFSSQATEARVGDARKLLRLFDDGKLDASGLADRVHGLAEDLRLPLAETSDMQAAVAEIEAGIAALSQQGTRLTPLAEGGESRVYLDRIAETVYKAVPFKAELMQIPPILDQSTITASNAHGTFLANHYGGMPLFDRARMLASVGGVCKTELVALTAGGVAVYKQPYLGDKEPRIDQVTAWAEQFGHTTLPTQEGPDVVEDMNQLPFVASGPAKGQFVVGLDLNPRNARLWNGWCIPFDPILRELHASEIASNPLLQVAVDKIALTRRRDMSVTSVLSI